MFPLRLLRFISYVIVLCAFCNSHEPQSSEDSECPHRINDGFLMQNYKPQPPPGQNVADKCSKIQNCSAACNSKYREYDGSCNNLKFPMWGTTNSAMVRLLPAKYSDGKYKPRKAMDGSELPNQRTVRTTVLPDKVIEDKKLSYLFSVFGQYISHDTVQTNLATSVQSAASCCDDKKWPSQIKTNCTPHPIPEDDEFYSKIGLRCIPKVRALTTNDSGCSLVPYQQTNPVTHFIDQSLIYGQTKEDAEKFRGEKGKLQISKIHNKIFPKASSDPQETCSFEEGDNEYCFDAGDGRVNQNPPMTVMVTIFMRCHNDLAEKLLKLNPKMSAEQLFEEVRRILIAVEIFIVRKEFMPLLVGLEFMEEAKMCYTNVDHDDIYDQNLNPSTLNEFSIVYRSLHSTLLDKLKLHDGEGKNSHNCTITEYFQRPNFAVENFDPLLESIIKSPMAKIDKHGAFTMNNKFGHLANEHGDDLDMISIAREREQGLPGFCDYMELLLNEPKITCWEDLERYFTQETISALKKVYKHFRDIDMFVGGIAECPYGNSLFGKLFTAIILDQFKRWLVGDWHSPTLKNGPGMFSKPQLLQLNEMNMTYLLCKYSDSIDYVPSRPFELSSYTVDCKSLPDIDLTPWKLL